MKKENKVNKAKEVKTNKVNKEVKVKASNFLALAIASQPFSVDRTLKNKAKFSNDNVVIRAYETCKGVIEENKLTPENVFAFCSEAFDKKKIDVQGKDIKRPQRVLASLCCKASNQARSTSSFAQDLKHIGNIRNRETIKKAFPAFDDTILQTIFKGTFLPSRTK